MKDSHFEIERKYLIRLPRRDWLEANADCTEIEQTYLLPLQPGTTERVRRRGRDGAYVYTHTVKKRLSALRRIEQEEEISEAAYRELLKRADPERRRICKQRWCFSYRDQLFELDVFPFWNDRAFLEIELEDERQQIALPPALRVIRDVTADKRYSNAALSREIPCEEIERMDDE